MFPHYEVPNSDLTALAIENYVLDTKCRGVVTSPRHLQPIKLNSGLELSPKLPTNEINGIKYSTREIAYVLPDLVNTDAGLMSWANTTSGMLIFNGITEPGATKTLVVVQPYTEPVSLGSLNDSSRLGRLPIGSSGAFVQRLPSKGGDRPRFVFVCTAPVEIEEKKFKKNTVFKVMTFDTASGSLNSLSTDQKFYAYTLSGAIVL